MLLRSRGNFLAVIEWLDKNSYEYTMLENSIMHPSTFETVATWDIPDEAAQTAFKLKWSNTI